MPKAFRLDPVLQLRQRQADQLHQQWLQLLQQQHQWDEQIKQVRDHIGQLLNQRALGLTEGQSHWMHYLKGLRNQESLLLQQLHQHKQLVEHHRHLVVAARIKEKSLEKLKTKHQPARQEALQRQDNELMDDLAQRITSLL